MVRELGTGHGCMFIICCIDGIIRRHGKVAPKIPMVSIEATTFGLIA